jgi:hypothetical protein
VSQRFETTKEQEDAIIDRLLGALSRSDGAPELLSEELADEKERWVCREYLEVIGLLAYDNEPMAPRAEVKERLMRALGAPRHEESRGVEQATVASFPSARRRSPGAETTSRWHDWALPLAAGLVFALLGLSGWQYVQLERQRGTIDRLAAQLDQAHQRTAQLAEYQGRLESVDSRLALVTSSGVEVCTLKPVGDPAPAESRGVLFVAADHQHWYLKVEGLVPCPQGRSYQLWFINQDGVPVSAGTFDPKVGVRVELSSETMPAGTVAVSITLEPAGGSPEPSGPAVLYGDEAMRIL